MIRSYRLRALQWLPCIALFGAVLLRADTITGVWPQPGTPLDVPFAPSDYYFWSAGGANGEDPLNDAGFVGFGQNGFRSTSNSMNQFNGNPAVSLWSSPSTSPVPEPGTISLVALGLAGLTLGSYRLRGSSAR